MHACDMRFGWPALAPFACAIIAFARNSTNYVRGDPKNADLKRKAYTAVAAKVARVAFGLLKTGTDYRRFPEATIPSGRIPSLGAVEALSTS